MRNSCWSKQIGVASVTGSCIAHSFKGHRLSAQSWRQWPFCRQVVCLFNYANSPGIKLLLLMLLPLLQVHCFLSIIVVISFFFLLACPVLSIQATCRPSVKAHLPINGPFYTFSLILSAYAGCTVFRALQHAVFCCCCCSSSSSDGDHGRHRRSHNNAHLLFPFSSFFCSPISPSFLLPLLSVSSFFSLLCCLLSFFAAHTHLLN